MEDIFKKLESVKQKLGKKDGEILDNSEPYKIKGRLNRDLLDLIKNKADGSTYNLRFNLDKKQIYWWHNERTKEHNINLSEGGIKKLADGSYGFFTNSPDKEGKMQNKQGTIQTPTIENILYLIEQTDEEFAKLFKVAYPNKEIVADAQNIQYHRTQEEVIEEAYKENDEYNNSEKRMVRRLAEIEEQIAKLLKEKAEIEQQLKSKNNKETEIDETETEK